jgi:hypothetical protein
MQTVTVAISLEGINYLFSKLLGGQIAQALKTHLAAPPTQTFRPPDFTVSNGSKYSGVSVHLSSGMFKSFNSTFGRWEQGRGDGSRFTVTINTGNVETDYAWSESFTETRWIPAMFHSPGHYGTPHPGSGNYTYSISIQNISIPATFKLAVGTGGYQLTYISSNPQFSNEQPNYPSGSVLMQPQDGPGCSWTNAAASLTNVGLDGFGSSVDAALRPIFASIADTGKLQVVRDKKTVTVEFDFLAPGESGLVFPDGGGIQIGAKGGVAVNEVPYPETPPRALGLPPVPTGASAPHVTYFIQDYAVNALFWGFHAAGALTATLASGDITDKQALETNSYAGGSLNNLALKYPGKFMSASLSAREAPTVSFQTVYAFTAQNLQAIQKALGPTVWTKFGAEIEQLQGQRFSSQTGLENELGLLDPNLSPYAPVIEQHTGMKGIVVNHTTRCVLNVLQQQTAIPVITFDVAQIFLMEGLQLGQSSSKAAQSVIFTFIQPMDKLPVASFVSSSLPGVNSGDFSDVWNALRPNWQEVFFAVGAAGLPLPHIPGFDFLFDKKTLPEVVLPGPGGDGYLSVTANMTYAPEKLAFAVRSAMSGQSIAPGI